MTANHTDGDRANAQADGDRDQEAQQALEDFEVIDITGDTTCKQAETIIEALGYELTDKGRDLLGYDKDR